MLSFSKNVSLPRFPLLYVLYKLLGALKEFEQWTGKKQEEREKMLHWYYLWQGLDDLLTG